MVTVAVPGGSSVPAMVMGPVHVPVKENGGGGGVGVVGESLPHPAAPNRISPATTDACNLLMLDFRP